MRGGYKIQWELEDPKKMSLFNDKIKNGVSKFKKSKRQNGIMCVLSVLSQREYE